MPNSIGRRHCEKKFQQPLSINGVSVGSLQNLRFQSTIPPNRHNTSNYRNGVSHAVRPFSRHFHFPLVFPCCFELDRAWELSPLFLPVCRDCARLKPDRVVTTYCRRLKETVRTGTTKPDSAYDGGTMRYQSRKLGGERPNNRHYHPIIETNALVRRKFLNSGLQYGVVPGKYVENNRTWTGCPQPEMNLEEYPHLYSGAKTRVLYWFPFTSII